MMAAASICEASSESEVFLVERNTILGRKVIISGGGRCNVTTGFEEIKEILKKYPRGSKFFRHALYTFPPEQVYEWMEAHGVPLKTDADFRVFPQSNKGQDVVGVFEEILKESKVKILYKTTAERVEKKGEKFEIELSSGEVLVADKLIITTGGQAYQRTGSQGDGYEFAKALGHKITELAPSLSAFLIEESWLKELPGISFKSVRLKLLGKESHEFTGPILFTHKGVTGPAVFALSSLAAYEVLDPKQPKQLLIDFYPDETYDELTTRLNAELTTAPRKSFSNSLGFFVPKSFARAICSSLKIGLDKKNAEVSKREINKVIESLKNTQITVVGRTPGEEFVTAGGIELVDINSKTMESKICSGLYFAGEILNIDGFTGGFNLQVAWATGRLAGQSVSS